MGKYVRPSLYLAPAALCAAASVQAQDRPMAAGLPSEAKALAKMCSAQLMLAAYERGEGETAWQHEQPALMQAGKAWVSDYATAPASPSRRRSQAMSGRSPRHCRR